MKLEQDEDLRILLNQVGHLYLKRSMILKKEQKAGTGGGGILYLLNEMNGISQKELADKMNVKPPSITVALRKLEAIDYITRKQDEKDQRITRIFITDKGREEANKIRKIMKQVDQEVFRGFTAEEKMFLRRLLLQMKENMTEKDGMDDGYCFHPHVHKKGWMK